MSDMQKIATFNYFEKPELLPLTYIYEGITYTGLPADAKRTETTCGTVTKITYTATIADSVELKAECTTYANYPVIEWLCYFTNTGNANTGIFEKIRPANAFVPGQKSVLKTNTGDFYSVDGFIDNTHAITRGISVRSMPSGGRSCDCAWPYQKLIFDDFGLNIAIGWSGTWFSEYRGTGDGVQVLIGQDRCRTYLKPGETYRTPTVTIMAYAGDEDYGVNLWRRWFYNHILVKENGKPLKGKTVTMEYDGSESCAHVDEANQLAGLEFVKKENYEANVWWIDAGWYDMNVNPDSYAEGNPVRQGIWCNTGTWRHDTNRFPNGLKPIGEKCAELGIDFLLWFEPLRVRCGTELHVKHPEWIILKSEEYDHNGNGLLDITNPDCFDWMCKHISGLIKEYKVKWYREDFNFPPSYYWEYPESKDQNRVGMVENLHVQAFYKFWDYLVEQNPGLLIDSCASGGRRNDLETMRRSVPLHHTDFGYGYKPVCQAFSYSMNRWLPYHKTSMQVWDDGDQSYPPIPEEEAIVRKVDSYALFNNIGPMMWIPLPSQLAEDKKLAQFVTETIIPAWKKAGPIMLTGDFYSLTEPHRDSAKWTIFQFHMPQTGEGLFKVMRNQQCEIPTMHVQPKAFDPTKLYNFQNAETGETFTMTGKEVIDNGITFTQAQRSAGIWFYSH